MIKNMGTATLQIPLNIPQGVSSHSISQITEQVTVYAQFLLSRIKKQEATEKSDTKGMEYIRSLHAVGGTVVPADEDGKGLLAEKYM